DRRTESRADRFRRDADQPRDAAERGAGDDERDDRLGVGEVKDPPRDGDGEDDRRRAYTLATRASRSPFARTSRRAWGRTPPAPCPRRRRAGGGAPARPPAAEGTARGPA